MAAAAGLGRDGLVGGIYDGTAVFPKYYPQTDISDTITMLGGFLMTFMAPWLKIYEVRDVPKEDLIWMKRIRYGLFMWPLLFDMAYQCYLLFLK